MAGAPRTFSTRMASARSSMERHCTYSRAWGRAVWSTRLIGPPGRYSTGCGTPEYCMYGKKKFSRQERTEHHKFVSLIFQVEHLSDLAPPVSQSRDPVAGLHGADPSAHLDKS